MPFRSSVRSLSSDLFAFSLFAFASLAIGISVDSLFRKPPLGLKYQKPAERISAASADQPSAITIIGLQETSELLNREDIIILDARASDFFEIAHIPGARNLSRDNFDTDFQSLEKELRAEGKTLLLYCSDIDCEDSAKVAAKLRNMGFARIKLFEGGFAEWEAAEMPTEEGK